MAAVATAAFAQGVVKFANTSTTLVSQDGAAITGPAGSYYFGLLTAAPGTTDPLQFTFSGVYATNTVTGRFQGGPNLGLAVPGWAVNTSRSYMVAGWNAALGHDFNSAWLTTLPAVPGGYFGLSGIGTGSSGGLDENQVSWPALVAFGLSPAISSGFSVAPVPEPTTLALAGLGAAALLIFRRRN